MKKKYELQVITPVHVGSGETLNHIDGYYANGMWYHVDLDKVLQHPRANINTLTSNMSQDGFQWQRYLSQRNIDIAEVSTYSLACPESPRRNDRIQEAIKGVGNRPYVPGSTLKGSIRTALLEEILYEKPQIRKGGLNHLKKLAAQRLRPRPGESKEKPASQIEKDAFGDDSNHDFLRALQVSDTNLLDSDALEIGLAWTVTIKNDQLVQKREGNRRYRSFIQQIQKGQRLIFTLKVDDFLFEKGDELGFSGFQQEILEDIPGVCHARNKECLAVEQDFFYNYQLTEIADFYDRLIRLNTRLIQGDTSEPEGTFLLQIGWGTGYNAKTVTGVFTDDDKAPEDLLGDLRRRFDFGRSHSPIFPKTRRILYRGQNPLYPLGWVKISPIQD